MASDHDIQNREHAYLGNDVGFKRTSSPALDVVIVKSGDYTYIAKAVPGTARATAAWAVQRIDKSVAGTTVFRWAGGGGFTQPADDLASLNYTDP